MPPAPQQIPITQQNIMHHVQPVMQQQQVIQQEHH